MLANMTTDANLLGTDLRLKKGQLVKAQPATNIPGGGYFASPASGEWGDDSILVTEGDLSFYDEREL